MQLFRGTKYFAAAILAAAFLCPAVPQAQGSSTGPISNSLSTMNGVQANNSITEKYLTQTLGNPKEEAAYQAFHKVDADQPDKKIKLGDAFLAK